MTKKNVKTMMLILVVLIIGLYFVSGTYARYTSTINGKVTAKVAKWAVTLNGVDMTTAEETMELTFEETEANNDVVDGYIAPGSELYSNDLEIDPTGTQVAMDYTIELGEITSNEELSGKIKIARLEKMVDGNWTNVNDFSVGSPYNGTIELVDQENALTSDESVTYRVVLAWDNVEDNNATDTELGVIAPEDVTMTVKVTAQQHITEPENV